jgi:hypothetical protein
MNTIKTENRKQKMAKKGKRTQHRKQKTAKIEKQN